jgi:hypothetical protein
MRVLELGNYVAPAYAGMILAEQGHSVTKWTNARDPILGLHRGEELWAWINHGKRVLARDVRELASGDLLRDFDAVIDNFRASTLEGWGIDPAALASTGEVVWVSLRDELGGRSFDALAQRRSWMEYAPWVPFYVGDTVAGLWLAFKALAAPGPAHYEIGHASCLQKLVEGELAIEVKRDGHSIPWDPEEYRVVDAHARVAYKGDLLVEPVRDREWKLAHLHHVNGRIRL